jgi:hypothetical protein
MPARIGLAVGVLALFFVVLPTGVASAHDYCVHQGYDWGCVKNAHHDFSACDAESDGAVVTSTAWDTDSNGHVVQDARVSDPDGAGGRCGLEHVSWVINDFSVCENQSGPGGLVCSNTFGAAVASTGALMR